MGGEVSGSISTAGRSSRWNGALLDSHGEAFAVAGGPGLRRRQRLTGAVPRRVHLETR